MSKLNLDAYYYGFKPTNNKNIDAILYAVAQAGAGWHNTEDWNEPDRDGISAAENIQIAADNAANNLLDLTIKE